MDQTMMRHGRATVYGGPPTWDPVETLLGLKFSSPMRFLVGRCLPGNPTLAIDSEELMAVSWLQIDGRWTHDEAGREALGWEPLYYAMAPAVPPWPPREHPAVVRVLGRQWPNVLLSERP